MTEERPAARALSAWMAVHGGTLRQSRYPRAGGHTTAYRLLPPAPARGRVVAAHGTGNDACFPLVALFKALVAEGWEVFSFDLDGHGRGSTSRWEDDTVREAVPDAVAHAAEGEPLPLHLLGHSLGAALVLRALTDGRLPDARSAVLLSAPLRIRPTLAAGAGELRGFFCADSWRQREHYGARGVVPAFGPFGRAAYPLRMAGGGGVAYVARVRRWVDSLELERAAPGVRVPTLLVAGSADRVVPPVQAERLAVRIPDVTLQAVPGATHWTLPFAPCAVAAVTRWLDARFPREE